MTTTGAHVEAKVIKSKRGAFVSLMSVDGSDFHFRLHAGGFRAGDEVSVLPRVDNPAAAVLGGKLAQAVVDLVYAAAEPHSLQVALALLGDLGLRRDGEVIPLHERLAIATGEAERLARGSSMVPQEPTPEMRKRARDWLFERGMRLEGAEHLAYFAAREVAQAQAEERERNARIASSATADPESTLIHPDIPFKKFGEAAKFSAHATAQAIAAAIREGQAPPPRGCAQHEADLAASQARVKELEETNTRLSELGSALVSAIDRAHASEEHHDVWRSAQIARGRPYRGPTYTAELAALRWWLSTKEAAQEAAESWMNANLPPGTRP